MYSYIVLGSLGFFIGSFIILGIIHDYIYLLALIPITVISFFSWLGVRYREKNNPSIDDFL